MATKVPKADIGKQDAVVFTSKRGSKSVTALVLTTGKMYDVDRLSEETMSQYLSTTYPSPINVVNAGDDGELTLSLNEMQVSVQARSRPAHHFFLPKNDWYASIFLLDFVYTIKNWQVYRGLHTSQDSTPVSKLPLPQPIASTALFHDNIFLLYKIETFLAEDTQLKTEVYSFSLSNFRTQRLATWNNTSSAVTFYYAGILHILTGRGNLWRVDDRNKPNLRLQRCHYGENTYFPSTNWSTDIPLCGAVVHGSELVVFSNALPYDVDLPKKTVADYSLKVKFMQILAHGKCHHVQLPESWLTKEI